MATTVLTRVDRELLERLRELAREEERQLLTVTNRAIREYIDKSAAT